MFNKIKEFFICWCSKEFKDIHTVNDGINRIPDSKGEYTCKRCRKAFRL